MLASPAPLVQRDYRGRAKVGRRVSRHTSQWSCRAIESRSSSAIVTGRAKCSCCVQAVSLSQRLISSSQAFIPRTSSQAPASASGAALRSSSRSQRGTCLCRRRPCQSPAPPRCRWRTPPPSACKGLRCMSGREGQVDGHASGWTGRHRRLSRSAS